MPVGQRAALAQLQDEMTAARLLEQPQRERPDDGVLIAEREAGLALVRREQVEVRELQDVAPPVRDLAVGDTQGPAGDLAHETADGVTVEDAVPEIAHDDDVGGYRVQ